MQFKFASAKRCNAVGGFCLFTNKCFSDFDVVIFFKCIDMAGKIAIGEIQQFLHFIEVNPFIDHECRHDAQPDTAFEFFVQPVNIEFLHVQCLSVFKMHEYAIEDVKNSKANRSQ